jgi:membrane protease YdiL (CAAX protease family)
LSFLNSLHEKPIWFKVFVFGLITVISFMVFTLFGILASTLFYGIDLLSSPIALNNLDDQNSVNALRMIQLFNALGAFVIPPIIFWWLNKPGESPLEPKEKFNFSTAIVAVITMIAALPFINWMAYLNESITLPEAFAWMKTAEEDTKILTEALLRMDSPNIFLFNFLVIAIIPAIGEEFFFRGTIQPLIYKGTGNQHIAIWVTAFLFSALHMQFFGFFPRMILGALFGYLFVWSKNIWYPIIGHFTNNGLAVMAAYFIQQGNLNPEFEEIGKTQITFSLGGFLLMAFMVYHFYQTTVHKKRSI